MSVSALNRTLQVAYPVAVLVAVLATAGLNLVQAGYQITTPAYPSFTPDPLDRYDRPHDSLTCSIQDHKSESQVTAACSKQNTNSERR